MLPRPTPPAPVESHKIMATALLYRTTAEIARALHLLEAKPLTLELLTLPLHDEQSQPRILGWAAHDARVSFSPHRLWNHFRQLDDLSCSGTQVAIGSPTLPALMQRALDAPTPVLLVVYGSTSLVQDCLLTLRTSNFVDLDLYALSPVSVP